MSFTKTTRVVVNGAALRQIMQCDNAQKLVNKIANNVCETANGMSSTHDLYVVHPRVLRVSAHAFVDCDGPHAVKSNHKHNTLQKAFWANQGG